MREQERSQGEYPQLDQSRLEAARAKAAIRRNLFDAFPLDAEATQVRKEFDHTAESLQGALRLISPWLRMRHGILQKQGAMDSLSVAITYNDKFMLREAYGSVDQETAAPLSPEHRVNVNSMTKLFTAVGIMQLAESYDGFYIEQPLSYYLPWLRKHPDSRATELTIQQALSHQTGFTRDGIDFDPWPSADNGSFPTKQQVAASLLRSPLVQLTSHDAKYSNNNAALLGQVIEAVTNLSYEEYITMGIIRPLGLRNTSFAYQPGRHATAYTDKNNAYSPIQANGFAPAMGLYSTPSDMCRFFDALRIDSGELLKPPSKMMMQKTKARNELGAFGLGSEIFIRNSMRSLSHGGGGRGFFGRTECREDGLTISTVCTSSRMNTRSLNDSIFAAFDYYRNHAPHGPIINTLPEGVYEFDHNSQVFTILIAAADNHYLAIMDAVAEPFASTTKLYPHPTQKGIYTISQEDGYGLQGECLIQTPTDLFFAGKKLRCIAPLSP